MKILKNIKVARIINSVIVGIEENSEFKTILTDPDTTDITDIVRSRLSLEESLKEYLCQVTEDQHLSEERIRYVMDDDSYRFLAVSNMTFSEQLKYAAFKQTIEIEINR